ncbi:hypothetical protein [Escherichia coli]|uniref:hypothetical protein n=1 Tax=Escherichia coli TaxID=562 RepID=UPI00201D2667|nr:hypothetical protein [Escherichia coli]
MHHSDVVSIAQNNVEINRVLSKTWKFILTAVPGGFFYSVFYGPLSRAFFISAPRSAHITSDNTTQKASAGAFDGVLFFTGRWWPFFIYRRKKYV